MKARVSLFFAFRYLVSREGRVVQLRSAIAGIALSLVPLVVVLEVANGMIEGITSRYVEVSTFHFQARPLADLPPGEMERILARVREVPGVTEAIPIATGLGLVYSASGRTGVGVRALPPDLYRTDAAFRRYLTITAGGFDLAEPDAALLSVPVAAELHVEVGARIRLLTTKSLPGGNFIVRPNQLVVTGIFTTGYNELDALSMYVSEAKGQQVFTDPGSRFIGIKVIDPYGSLATVTWNLKRAIPPSWYLYSWFDLEKPMYKTFETTKNLLLFIMALIVGVASVNISSSLMMLVIERSPETAILKSIGADPGGIARSFLFSGFVVGTVGTFIGMAFGLLVAVNINAVIAALEGLINGGIEVWQLILSPFAHESPVHVTLLSSSYYLAHVPIRLDWQELGAIAVMSILLATIAAWFPARRAGRTRPLEVLRRH